MKDFCATNPKLTGFIIPQTLTISEVNKQNILDFTKIQVCITL